MQQQAATIKRAVLLTMLCYKISDRLCQHHGVHIDKAAVNIQEQCSWLAM